MKCLSAFDAWAEIGYWSVEWTGGPVYTAWDAWNEPEVSNVQEDVR